MTEEVHFDSTDGSPYYAPFSVYRHNATTGERQRLFAGFWDNDGDGTWNIPLLEDGSPYWTEPAYGSPSYEPIYCWVGYDPEGNEISYNPANDAIYIADNALSAPTTANTTWGDAPGEFVFPYVTATLICMYLDDATPPWGNKIMFYTNKSANTQDILHINTEPVSINAITSAIKDFQLSQNYPNPFNPVTYFEIQAPERTKINIEIYNVLGQKVKTIFNDVINAGNHTFHWNGLNDNGMQLSSGIYFYRLHTDRFVKSRKMILLR